MLIRSQDKMNLVDLRGIGIYIDQMRCEAAYIAGIWYRLVTKGAINISLGKYITLEKAMKVLDMIEEAYTDGNEWLCVPGKVFQMPADGEVKV